MKLLEQEYTVKGQRDYKYKVVRREGQVAIVEQLNRETDELIGYEVFEIIQYPDRMSPDNKVFIPAKEVPPSNEMWGSRGYSVSTMERAEIRFQELCNRVNGKLAA